MSQTIWVKPIPDPASSFSRALNSGLEHQRQLREAEVEQERLRIEQERLRVEKEKLALDRELSTRDGGKSEAAFSSRPFVFTEKGMDTAKALCLDLGYVKQTEKFADCVLKMYNSVPVANPADVQDEFSPSQVSDIVSALSESGWEFVGYNANQAIVRKSGWVRNIVFNDLGNGVRNIALYATFTDKELKKSNFNKSKLDFNQNRLGCSGFFDGNDNFNLRFDFYNTKKSKSEFVSDFNVVAQQQQWCAQSIKAVILKK